MLQTTSSKVRVCYRDAKQSAGTCRRQALRRGGRRPLHPLVPAVFSWLSRSGRTEGERGLSVDHTTVWRWVQRYAPELERRVWRELRRTSTSWRVDETYVRVAGRWRYLFRAVDSAGATLDFYLSENRDAAPAKHFFSKEHLRLDKTRTLFGQSRRFGAIPPEAAPPHVIDNIKVSRWAHQDLNLGPTDYESAALTN